MAHHSRPAPGPPDEFSLPTVGVLAARCNYRCSNPECRIPTTIPLQSTSFAFIGQAVYIKGRRAGSARHDPTQDDADRIDASNAIHLCCNCHKLVNSPGGGGEFSAEVLLRWKRDAEREVVHRFYKTLPVRTLGVPK